jgi:hypothetical protein
MISLSSLINVQISLATAAAQGQNTTNLMLLTNSTVIDLTERFREYTSSTAVGVDFGTNGPEFAAAELYFAQTPQPTLLLIGRWAQAAAAGQLIGAELTAAEQVITNFNTIADAGFTIGIDGGAVEHIVGIELTGLNTLAAVAGAITTALAGAATCTWNAVYGFFEFTSATTGAASAITFLTAAVGGGVTDISNLLGGRATNSGAYLAAGQIAETALACATLFDAEFGGQWYGLMMPTINEDSDNLAVAQFIESSTFKHFYGVTSSEAGCLVPTSTTDIGYILANANLKKTAWQYSSTNSVAFASAFGRILTTNYAAANAVISLMWQNMPGLAPENLNATQQASIAAKNGNVFAQTASGTTATNGSPVFLPGTTASTNVFIDTVIGADNFGIDLQLACFNAAVAAALAPGKIPQTDAGTHILVVACEGACAQYLANGFLGPDNWNYAGFGALQQGQYLETGSYVYAASIVTQLAANRAARKSVPIQIAGTLAGAINTAAVLVTLVP